MKKKIFKISLFVLFLLLVGFAFYNSNYYQDMKAEKNNNEIKVKYIDIGKHDEYDNSVILEYQKQFNNTDIIGELSIPNTDLKVPVAHTSDNEYYLSHLLDKSYNTAGSVFLDYRNNISDRKILIYGHNSTLVDTEFTLLENYANKDYYDQHSDIYLKTLDEEYHYKIFSVYIATKDYRHVNLLLNDSEYINHLKWFKEQSIYDTSVDVSDEDILVLQTCYYQPKGSYLIIVAKKIK